MCPRIFHIYGPLWVNGYGLMIAIGFFVFTCLTFFNSRRKKLISDENYLNVLFLGFLSAVFGGRLLFVLFNFSSFDSIVEIFYPWVGGFSLFGSIIIVLLTTAAYLRLKKIPIFEFFDVIVVYVPILQAIARLGCLLAGCCYGLPTSPGSWGITFTDPHSLAPCGVSLYPTQLYSSIASFAIFIILYLISRRSYRVTGTLVLLYLMLESLSRFTVEFWRWDKDAMIGALSSMQWIVGSLFLASLGTFLVRRYFDKKSRRA